MPKRSPAVIPGPMLTVGKAASRVASGTDQHATDNRIRQAA